MIRELTDFEWGALLGTGATCSTCFLILWAWLRITGLCLDLDELAQFKNEP